jgi:DNA invertase Pin-like site-specific DNA recombinase
VSPSDRQNPPQATRNLRRHIGYARVSTDEQSLNLQVSALKASGCTEIFQDHGVSGAVAKRPGLEAAFQRLKPGDVFVVWRLDRLGRSLPHLIEVVNWLADKGVDFHSLSESIDTSSSGGRLIFHIMGALAEFERSLISERTRAGMRAAKESGIHTGRPAMLTPVQLKQALAALGNGQSLQEVAAQLKVHSRTLQRALKRHENLEAFLKTDRS